MSDLFKQATPELFQKAVAGDASAENEIFAMLDQAVQTNALWPTAVKNTFQNGLNALAAKWKDAEKTDLQEKILRNAMIAGLNAGTLRQAYASLAQKDFAAVPDKAAIISATGILDMMTPVLTAGKRWRILAAAVEGAVAFNQECTRSTVQGIQETAVVLKSDRSEKKLAFSEFLATCMIIQANSELAAILNGKADAPDLDDRTVVRRLESCVIRACALPKDFIRNIVSAAARKTVQEDKTEESADKADAAKPWDESRTVLELAKRLETAENLDVPGELHYDNLLRILQDAAPRAEQNASFAISLAYIMKMAAPDLKQWLVQTMQTLADTADIWQGIGVCADITDKLPIKIVPFWLEAVLAAKGADFLATLCLVLPYRLWLPVGKLLGAAEQKNLLEEKVLAALATNKVTADLLYWLWRSNLTDAKNTYLADPALIFKTLHQEAKGNYLKAQRDLRKLLIDNLDFKKQVMLNGKKEAVVEFVRCIKHLPLLDSGEIQSLLVSISEMYPEFQADIEERHQGPIKFSIGKLTSIRGYNRRVAELNHIINVEIPENTEAIKTAAAHGDFRENSEFKFAKERQIQLNTRRREYEESLNGVQTTDFTNVKVTDSVIPGCTVVIRYRNNAEQTIHILGMLDSEPEKSIISYEAPLGKVLLGNKINTRFSHPNGEKATIVKILPLTKELLDYVADR